MVPLTGAGHLLTKTFKIKKNQWEEISYYYWNKELKVEVEKHIVDYLAVKIKFKEFNK